MDQTRIAAQKSSTYSFGGATIEYCHKLREDNFAPIMEISFKTRIAVDGETITTLNLHNTKLEDLLLAEYKEILEQTFMKELSERKVRHSLEFDQIARVSISE